MTEKQRIYPISDQGDVLRGMEKIRLYQLWGDEKHYLRSDCQSWTSHSLRAGTWIVDPHYNWFETVDVKIELIGKPQPRNVKRYRKLDLFTT